MLNITVSIVLSGRIGMVPLSCALVQFFVLYKKGKKKSPLGEINWKENEFIQW